MAPTYNLKLVKAPDPILTKKVPYLHFSEWNVVELGNEMLDVMRASKGIGLAANQVNINAAIFVMGSADIPGFPQSLIIVNPQILDLSEDVSRDMEGCLSFPELYFAVARPSWVKAKFQDEFGQEKEMTFTDYVARCFLHEFDHLQGRCFTDGMSKFKIERLRKQYKKKIK